MTDSTQPGTPHWHSPVQAPAHLQDPDDKQWDHEADFLVVGYGGAGMAAALAAAEQGLSVIAADLDQGGGATAMNGGIVYAGGGTRIQKEAGVQDDAEEMFRYLEQETQGVISDETLRRFCAGSAEMIDWLTAHGVRFDSTAYLKKTSYPYSSYFLYHSDNSLVAKYAAHAKPAARGHKVYSPPSKKATGFGANLTDPLRASARQHGVQFMAQTEIRQLVVDGNGKVIGVRALQMPLHDPVTEKCAKLTKKALFFTTVIPPAFPGFAITNAIANFLWKRVKAMQAKHRVECWIRARRGVCLSTGGFVYNREMVHEYASHYDEAMPLGHPTGDNGSGIRLGQSVGGVPERLERISAWRFLNPPRAFAQAMLVNGRGERFCDETMYGASIGDLMCEENGGVGYLILDQHLYKEAWRQLRNEKMLPFQSQPARIALLFGRKKAKDLHTLAGKCGFDPAAFEQAIAAYNRVARKEEKDAFQKDPKDIFPLTEGPYYAIDVSVNSTLFPLPTMTVGGLKINERTGEVVNAQGREIQGLYAAGRTAIGLPSNIYVSGLSAADCIFSGRRAGGHAAAGAQTRDTDETT